MSGPSPANSNFLSLFEFYTSSASSSLDHLKTKLKETPDSEAKDEAIKAIENMKVLAKDPINSLNARQVNKAFSEEANKVSNFTDKFFTRDNELTEDYLFDVVSLQNMEEVFLNLADLKSDSLQILMSNEGLLDWFLSKLQTNDHQAIKIFEQAVENKNEIFIDLVLEFSNDFTLLPQFFEKYLQSNHPFILQRVCQCYKNLPDRFLWIVDYIAKHVTSTSHPLIETLHYNLQNLNSNFAIEVHKKLIPYAKKSSFITKWLTCLNIHRKSKKAWNTELKQELNSACESHYKLSEVECRDLFVYLNRKLMLFLSHNISSSLELFEDLTLHFKVQIFLISLNRALKLTNFAKSSFQFQTSNSIETEYFPRVEALFVGYDYITGDTPSAVAQLVDKHNVSIVTAPFEYQHKIVATPSNSTLHILEGSFDDMKWMRDIFYTSQNPETKSLKFHIPRISVTHEIKLDDYKLKRFNRIKGILCGDKEDKEFLSDPEVAQRYNFKLLGQVSSYLQQVAFCDYLLKIFSTDDIQEQFTYSEMGNTMIGENASGEKIAIIGKDTYELSKQLIESDLKELGYQTNKDKSLRVSAANTDSTHQVYLSENDMKQFFAQDLSIRPSNIIFVEQPGAFHLDMSMCFVGPNTVMLNDSVATYTQVTSKLNIEETNKLDSSFKQFSKKELDLLKEYSKVSQAKKLIEDITADQLEQNGITVIRVAGNLINPLAAAPEYTHINPFNHLSITTPQGKKIIIVSGSSPQDNEFIKKLLIKHYKEDIDEILVLDSKISQSLLANNGGVHCLIQPLQTLPKSITDK